MGTPAASLLSPGLRFASELRPTAGETEERVVSSFPSLDALLDGGFQRGGIAEVSGRRSCGRFALVLSALAAATQSGELASLIDLGGGLDPQQARTVGIELSRLLWVRPKRAKAAFASAELILGAGIPVVVLECGVTPAATKNISPSAWMRLAHAAQTSRGCLIVSAPFHLVGSVARTAIALDRVAPLWQGRAGYSLRLSGRTARVTVTKHRNHASGGWTGLRFLCSETIGPFPGNPPETALGATGNA